MSDRVVLRFSDVSLRRGDTEILRDVTLSLREGERWAVVGPNGAGKSTLLQLAATTMHPTSGTVDVLGHRMGRVDVFSLRPSIGVSAASLADQIPGGERAIDVVQTAAWAVTGRWRERYDEVDSARAQGLLEQFGVGAFAQRRFGTLSEGERKRVLLARAMMTDPELLLLDEPAAGLDLGAREDLVSRLGLLARDPGSPVCVLVTHHVEEIPVGFTHAIALRDGRVVAAGELDSVITPGVLTECFGLPLQVQRIGRRWFASLA